MKWSIRNKHLQCSTHVHPDPCCQVHKTTSAPSWLPSQGFKEHVFPGMHSQKTPSTQNSEYFQAYPFPSLPTPTGTELEMPSVGDGLLIILFCNGLSLSDQEDREAGLTICKRKENIFLVPRMCLCVFCYPAYWSGCWRGLIKEGGWEKSEIWKLHFSSSIYF